MIITPLLPYAFSFAAGAMIFVVVEELIPESKRGFLAVKMINIVYALIFGMIGYLTGF